MISVLVSKSGNYPVSGPKLKKALKAYLEKNGIVSDAQVSVCIVGEKRMKEISRKYLNDKKLHNVLSFTTEETDKKFIYPPDKIYLGEIIICYPKVLEEAKREKKLIDEKAIELLLHGCEHLLGKHHE